MYLSLSLFLQLMVVRAENPNSHRYEVENCMKTINASFQISGYSVLIEIQTVSKEVFKCLIFKLRSDEIDTNSSCSDTFKSKSS